MRHCREICTLRHVDRTNERIKNAYGPTGQVIEACYLVRSWLVVANIGIPTDVDEIAATVEYRNDRVRSRQSELSNLRADRMGVTLGKSGLDITTPTDVTARRHPKSR